MSVMAFSPQQVGRPAQQDNHFVRVPAPVHGIDTRVSVSDQDPKVCIYTFNLMPYDYGMRVRHGYREWAIGVDAGASIEIRTIIPFISSIDGAKLLFAVTNEGIWDVTTTDVPPVSKVVFADQSANAGWGVFSHYTNDAEDDVLFYADSINGLFSYDADTGVWAQATGITGPVIVNINFVVVHKQRLWMIEENSTKAWYLPLGSNSGQATEFFFGSKFKQGGNLVGLYNWTIDGGDGVDDYLVAVSRAGDVLPYRGEDPSAATTWSLVGTYFIGYVPIGPNIGTQTGGELYLLSIFGLTSLNDLLRGVNTVENINQPNSTSVSRKIAERVRARMELSQDVYGWDIQTVPSEGGLVIKTPKVGNWSDLQYVFNITTSGWGFWRDVPMTCFQSFDGRLVFGDALNRILFLDINADNVKLTPPEVGPNGVPIKFSTLTMYQSMNNPALSKRVTQIRPDFVAGSKPSFTCSARYDYDLSEVILQAITPNETRALWDVGIWDQAVWAQGGLTGYSITRGTWGKGRYVAIAMIGESRDDTRFIGWDLAFTAGGFLT